MTCRGVRGATTACENTPEAILDATSELLQALAHANGLRPEALASVMFTVTPDLDAAFPAQAARRLGWTQVPLLDSVEIPVAGALPRCIRVLIHWNASLPASAVRHIYLREAAALRPDLALDAPVGASGPYDRNGEIPMEQTEVRSRTDATPDSIATAPRGPLTVAYQGEPGAYSQEAIFQRFGPDAGTLPCATFENIFASVEEGRAGYGLLPVENSQTGSVHPAYDLLLDHDLRVVGEVKLRVSHCLLAPRGSSVEGIQQVRSHPQALAQIERYLRRHGWQAVPAYDTAGAARELAASPEPGTAVAASALAGQIYDLEVLERGIEDAYDNTTRFFVLGRAPAPNWGAAASKASAERVPSGDGPDITPGTKTSLVFATAHEPGALHRALGEFASRGLNLTRIESRPRRNRPWNYVFYLDFEGHWQDPPVAQALVATLANAAFLKLLGSYPAAE